MEQEKASLSLRLDKGVREYEKLSAKHAEVEKSKKELDASVLTFQNKLVKQKEESDSIVASLQTDHASLARQVQLQHSKEEDLISTNERRCKALMRKLNDLEQDQDNNK